VAEPFTIGYRSFVAGDMPRPILGMDVTGVNGQKGAIYGLVDSGADITSLPFGWAPVLGYTPTTLTQEDFNQAGGTGTAYRAKTPCTAFVPEISEVVVTFLPSFIPGGQFVLWGRTDFMAVYDVTFQESQQRFIIQPV
jgi:hypothetical protein